MGSTAETTQPGQGAEPAPGAEPGPLVSVLVVNYNYAHYLPEALESALAQTYRSVEIVVCDDGSTDDSREVIRSYAAAHPARIRYVFKENGGVGSALNAAFAEARGDVIAFLDADDLFTPEKLERVTDYFDHRPDVGLIVNRMVKFDEHGAMTGLIPQFGDLDSGWLRDKLLGSGGHWSFSPASGITLRRACADRIFPIPDKEFRTEADSYVFTQGPMFWAVGALMEPLTRYRAHSSNVTSSQTVDAKWAEKTCAGIERMCRALEATARREGWRLPQVEDNPVYTEMAYVKDYHQGAGLPTLLKDLGRAWRAALKCRTKDRPKVLVKPVVLTATALLPRKLGTRVMESMYLPTETRARIARGLLRRRQHDPGRIG